MSQEDAEEVLNKFQSIELEIHLSSLFIADAYGLAIKCQRTVYNSRSLALSLQQQCQFLTADKKLVNSISDVFSNVMAIANGS